MTVAITLAYGDGNGPDIMESALHVLREAGADITVETVELGARIYQMGSRTGILPSSWEPIRRTGILLKAPTDRPPHTDGMDVTASLLHALHHEGPVERQEYYAHMHEAAPFNVIEYAAAEPPEGYHPLAAFNAYATAGFALFETGDTPSGALQAALALLAYTGQNEAAQRIHIAWQRTLADGIHTADIFQKRISYEKATAQAFGQAIAERLWLKPRA